MKTCTVDSALNLRLTFHNTCVLFHCIGVFSTLNYWNVANNPASPPKYLIIRTSKKCITVSVKPNILSIFKFLLLSLKVTHTHIFFTFSVQDLPRITRVLILSIFFFFKLACRICYSNPRSKPSRPTVKTPSRNH